MEIVSYLQESEILILDFTEFQLLMHEAGHPTADPLQRGGSEFYHNCYFHSHADEQEEQDCVSRAT